MDRRTVTTTLRDGPDGPEVVETVRTGLDCAELVARLRSVRRGFGTSMWADGAHVNPDGPAAADALEAAANRIAELEAQAAGLREALDSCSAALQRLHTDIEALMADSVGVAGLHLNGDVATWEELAEGGRFSDWLGDPLWAARNAWSDARAALSAHPQGEG